MNTLIIDIIEQEGALQRIIGLIERRGFSIATLEKTPAFDGQTTLKMQVSAREGLRPMDVLMRQITRLFDVKSVMSSETDPESVPLAYAMQPPGRTPCRTQA